MQCPDAQTLFTDFADNTLNRAELHTLTDHLLGCPACALEWQEFQQTLRLVHDLEPQALPADFLPGIQAKLAHQGILDRVWALAENLNFSLSIPAAATIFTIAMLAGFLLKTTLPEQPTIFPASSTQISALRQGEILTPRRAPVPNAMFAVSHTEMGQDGDLMPLARTTVSPHLPQDHEAHRLLSPDMHVLFADIDRKGQIALCQEMLRRNWQLHCINTSLFLVHLPQTDLKVFHELLGHHHVALMPAAAAETDFGSDKKVLTAALLFQ